MLYGSSIFGVAIVLVGVYALGAGLLVWVAQRIWVSMLLARARRAFAQGADRTVLGRLARVLAVHPESAPAYMLRSRVFHHMGDEVRALADANYAIHLAPHDYRGYVTRAALHDYTGSYRDAIRDLELAVHYNPRWLEGYINLALHHLALGAPGPCLEALEALCAHAGRHMLHYNALVMAGLVYEKNLRDFDAAIEAYSRAIALAPERQVAYLMRAWARRARGEYRAAAEDLLTAGRCAKHFEDRRLHTQLNAQYDPWLYLVAPDIDDHEAWRAMLRSGALRYTGMFRRPAGAHFHLN